LDIAWRILPKNKATAILAKVLLGGSPAKLCPVSLTTNNMKEQLQELIKEMEEVRGRWDGKTGGYMEEQADTASDIIDNARELIDLINKLNGTN
jgi:hypothetical protein